MYFKSIRKILDSTIDEFSRETGRTKVDIHAEMVVHISKTQTEHYNPEPDIDYDNPLCRLGYLFVHAGANATLFERTITRSSALSALIENCNGSLSICAVGGGPGTELLGLVKYLCAAGFCPSRLHFTVLDGVPEWAESWHHLAAEATAELETVFESAPAINCSFSPMDVMEAKSYMQYAWLFRTVDVMVFNYLLSENKVWLSEFQPTLDLMVKKAKSGCRFVFIDRLEAGPFCQAVRDLIANAGLTVEDDFEVDGCMDEQESELAPYPGTLSRRPRRWFRNFSSRKPTVFSIVAAKP